MGVVRKYGENTRNDNGNRLIDFCRLNGLIIANTFFDHKDIHKYTRKAPSRNERSIIDYILIEKSRRHLVKNIRVKRGPEIGSDHYLVKAQLIKEDEQLQPNQINKKKLPYKNEKIKSYLLKHKEKR